MSDTKKRYNLIDFIRGLAVINMVVYHALWDAVNIFGANVPLIGTQAGYLWQQCICWCFIFLSGFSMNLGRKSYKRGVEVFLGGAAVTAVTLVVMPENRVVFGVLTFIGLAMLITTALSPLLAKVKPTAGFAVSTALFLITRNINNGSIGFEGIRIWEMPRWLYRGYLSTFFGFTADGFYSSDYFSLFPWLFLFLAGYFCFKMLNGQNKLQYAEKSLCPPIELIGRKSFPIYLAHQPLIYLVLTLADKIIY